MIKTESLSHKDLVWGRKQFDRMLSARPNMASFPTSGGETRDISQQDLIWQYAVKRFSGHNLPTRVVWGGDPSLDIGSPLAAHQTPEDGQKGVVYIRQSHPSGPMKGQLLSFEELWSSLIYEFFNMENTAGFFKLENQAIWNRIDKATWIIEAARLEHGALLRMVEFYHTVWYPWASRNSLAIDPYVWRTDTPKSFDDFLAPYFADMNGYPWNVWGEIYDVRIAKSAKNNRELHELIK